MPRLPDPPPTPFGSRCSNRLTPYSAACGRPRIHLGQGPTDVWLCLECDMLPEPPEPRVPAYVRQGPPRLINYIRTGDRS